MAQSKPERINKFEVIKIFPPFTLSKTLAMGDSDYKYTEESRLQRGKYILQMREKFWWEK